MAIQAVLGLGALGTVIGGVVVRLIEFFASRIGKRLAVMTVLVASFITCYTVLLNTIVSFIVDLITGLPEGAAGGAASTAVSIAQTLAMFLPTNTMSCLNAIIGTELAIMSCGMMIRIIKLQSEVL